MALANYTDLSSAVDTWADRSYTSDQKDEFIRTFESRANRRLGSNFQRKSSTTVTTDSDGIGTIPTGCRRVESLVRGLTGSEPLKQVNWDALLQRNPYGDAAEPRVFAIRGTSLRLDTPTADDFIAVFWSTLTGLSNDNATNWMLTDYPDAYLFGVRAVQCAFEEDEARAAIYKALSDEILDGIKAEADVAEYGNAEITFEHGLP